SSAFEQPINMINGFAASFLIADLIFKYVRIKHIPEFLKKSWLDIIAIFPFFLLFRVFEEAGLILHVWESTSNIELVLDEAETLEKEAVGIIRFSSRVNKVTRAGILAKFIKPITRSPRLIKLIAYYEKPTGQHHPHEKGFKLPPIPKKNVLNKAKTRRIHSKRSIKHKSK
ncbi:MAG: hypothetical protein ABIJ08_01795, partial [Nanoarchaeota archaeon]